RLPRLSHNLFKPPERCRIEAADRRYYTWPERTAARKRMPVERKSENFCRWQTSAAWMTSRTCSRRPLPNSWRTVWRQSWMRTWATANMTTRTRLQKTEIQNCIIHQLRNSSKYVSYKDLKALMTDLKAVYAAVDEQSALDALDVFGEHWDKKYPKISKSWRDNWAKLSTYFKYPQ